MSASANLLSSPSRRSHEAEDSDHIGSGANTPPGGTATPRPDLTDKRLPQISNFFAQVRRSISFNHSACVYCFLFTNFALSSFSFVRIRTYYTYTTIQLRRKSIYCASTRHGGSNPSVGFFIKHRISASPPNPDRTPHPSTR